MKKITITIQFIATLAVITTTLLQYVYSSGIYLLHAQNNRPRKPLRSVTGIRSEQYAGGGDRVFGRPKYQLARVVLLRVRQEGVDAVFDRCDSDAGVIYEEGVDGGVIYEEGVDAGVFDRRDYDAGVFDRRDSDVGNCSE